MYVWEVDGKRERESFSSTQYSGRFIARDYVSGGYKVSSKLGDKNTLQQWDRFPGLPPVSVNRVMRNSARVDGFFQNFQTQTRKSNLDYLS